MNFNTLLAAILLPLVSGQVELTTENNDATFSRQPRQTVNAFELSQQVTQLMATVSTQAEELSLLRSADSPIALGVNAVATDMATRTQGLTAQTATNAATIAAMQSTLAMTVTNVNGQLASASADLAAQAASLSRSVASTMASLDGTISTRISEATSTMASSMATLNTSVNRQLSSAVATVGSKLDARVNMWSGGCGNRGGSGWQEFCLNVVHFDTSAPKFARKTGTRFHALVNGIFTIDFRVISESCNWAHTLIYVANRHWLHMNDWQGTGAWQHKHAHLTHKIANRQEFWARKYSGCWNAWHRTDNSGHARITVKWDGEWNGQG